MTSTASKTIIDQWVVSVSVAPEPPAAPAQLPAPAKRVYSEDVWARARLLHPAPGYVTRAELDAIANELDRYAEIERAKLRRCYQIGEYAPVGMCTPGRSDTLTGRE